MRYLVARLCCPERFPRARSRGESRPFLPQLGKWCRGSGGHRSQPLGLWFPGDTHPGATSGLSVQFITLNTHTKCGEDIVAKQQGLVLPGQLKSRCCKDMSSSWCPVRWPIRSMRSEGPRKPNCYLLYLFTYLLTCF